MASYDQWTLHLDQADECIEANQAVLVVEDDKLLGELIGDTLQELGFLVTIAATGRAALEQLHCHSINVILLDLSLPEMSGFEIYERLQQDAETKHIPVLLATAWDDDTYRDRARQLGLRYFLPKPFTEDQLLASMLTLLTSTSDLPGHNGNRQ